MRSTKLKHRRDLLIPLITLTIMVLKFGTALVEYLAH
jgi:hypothetical protein